MTVCGSRNVRNVRIDKGLCAVLVGRHRRDGSSSTLVESGRSVSHSKTRDTGKVAGVQNSDRLSDELKLWVRATEVPKYRVLRKTEILSSRMGM